MIAHPSQACAGQDSCISRDSKGAAELLAWVTQLSAMPCMYAPAAFTLDFHGRVKEASVKNFQLVHWDHNTDRKGADLMLQVGREQPAGVQNDASLHHKSMPEDTARSQQLLPNASVCWIASMQQSQNALYLVTKTGEASTAHGLQSSCTGH